MADIKTIYTGYLIVFDKPTKEGNIYTKDSFNLDELNLNKTKLIGELNHFVIDDIGVKIEKNEKD